MDVPCEKTGGAASIRPGVSRPRGPWFGLDSRRSRSKILSALASSPPVA
jgi:hypothetical protein